MGNYLRNQPHGRNKSRCEGNTKKIKGKQTVRMGDCWNMILLYILNCIISSHAHWLYRCWIWLHYKIITCLISCGCAELYAFVTFMFISSFTKHSPFEGRVFENKVCGKIFVPKRGEVIWEWRNFFYLNSMSRVVSR